MERDFSGNPAVKILLSNAVSVGSILGWGAKIPHALWPKNQNIRQKHIITDSIMTLFIYLLIIVFKFCFIIVSFCLISFIL